MKKNSRVPILLGLLCACAFGWCLNRDIRIEKQSGHDLRNRVVGARLQMDGKLPYFYYWRPEHGLRYYDPIKKDTTYSNAITASPFFHHLLYPIANLPQRQISRIWLAVEYSLFIGCLLIALSFTKNTQQRWAVVITGMMLLFTTGWLNHIQSGQNYLLYPFLCLAFLFFFRRTDKLLFSFFAGLSAVVLVLSRPTTILLFLPSLLLINRYSLKSLFIFFTPILILISYFFINNTERSFWIDYKKALAAHVIDHQSGSFGPRNDSFNHIYYKNWEGWNRDSVIKEKLTNPLKLKLEFSSVKAIANNVFHKQLSTTTLTTSLAILIILLTAIFFFKRRKDLSIDIATTSIFGFCLYMLCDLFSPILRSEYYTTQWIFPLLFCASFYDRRYRIFHLLLTLGLLLNVLDVSFIKMRHTLGEYLILVTLLWFSFFGQSMNKPVEAPYKGPSA